MRLTISLMVVTTIKLMVIDVYTIYFIVARPYLFNSVERYVCTIYGYPREKLVNVVRSKLFDKKFTKGGKVIDMALLPPCSLSLVLHIKRANYVAKIWRSFLTSWLDAEEITESGWLADGETYWVDDIFHWKSRKSFAIKPTIWTTILTKKINNHRATMTTETLVSKVNVCKVSLHFVKYLLHKDNLKNTWYIKAQGKSYVNRQKLKKYPFFDVLQKITATYSGRLPSRFSKYNIRVRIISYIYFLMSGNCILWLLIAKNSYRTLDLYLRMAVKKISLFHLLLFNMFIDCTLLSKCLENLRSNLNFLDVIGEAVVTSEIGSNVLKVVDDEIRKVEAAVNEEKAKINKLGLTSNPYERPEDLIEYKSCWAVPNFPEYKPTPIRELKKLKSSNGNQHASDSVLTTPYLPQYSYSTSKNVELSYMPTPINSKKSENDDAISKSLSSYVLNSKYSDDHSKNKQKCDVDKKELLESEKTALLNDDKNSSLELESSIICEVDEKQTDTKNENNDKIDSSSHKIKISSKHKRKESSKSSSSSHSKHKTKSSVSDSSKKIEKSSDSKSKKSKHSSHNTKDEQSKDSKSDTKEKKRKHSSHHSSDNTSKKKQKLSSSDKNKSKHHSSSSSHKVNDSNNSSGKKSKESHGKDKKHSKHKKDSSSTKHSKVQSKDNKGEKKKNNNESSKSNVKENDKQSSSLTVNIEEDGANFIKQLGKKRTAHQPSLVRENNEASLKPKISPAEVMHNRFVQLQKSSVTDHDTIMVGPYFTLHHL
ncbi:hypothetical protein GQR58_003606 [Nymphon striatum]|nr:hypothetical protein GQR58_003606 [Nymphon striatum]